MFDRIERHQFLAPLRTTGRRRRRHRRVADVRQHIDQVDGCQRGVALVRDVQLVGAVAGGVGIARRRVSRPGGVQRSFDPFRRIGRRDHWDDIAHRGARAPLLGDVAVAVVVESVHPRVAGRGVVERQRGIVARRQRAVPAVARTQARFIEQQVLGVVVDRCAGGGRRLDPGAEVHADRAPHLVAADEGAARECPPQQRSARPGEIVDLGEGRVDAGRVVRRVLRGGPLTEVRRPRTPEVRATVGRWHELKLRVEQVGDHRIDNRAAVARVLAERRGEDEVHRALR